MENSTTRHRAYLAAESLIKAYVLRGDSMKSLSDGYLGCACQKYYASIGGYSKGKRFSNDTIIVTKLDGIEIEVQAFKLKYVFDMILQSRIQPTLFG